MDDTVLSAALCLGVLLKLQGELSFDGYINVWWTLGEIPMACTWQVYITYYTSTYAHVGMSRIL